MSYRNYNYSMPDKPPFQVYVGNLPKNVVQADFKIIFPNSSIKEVRMIRDRDTDVFKGYAYVEFDDLPSLEHALKVDDSMVGDNHTIRVKLAPGRNSDRGRGGQRGGYGSGYSQTKISEHVPAQRRNTFNDDINDWRRVNVNQSRQNGYSRRGSRGGTDSYMANTNFKRSNIDYANESQSRSHSGYRLSDMPRQLFRQPGLPGSSYQRPTDDCDSSTNNEKPQAAGLSTSSNILSQGYARNTAIFGTGRPREEVIEEKKRLISKRLAENVEIIEDEDTFIDTRTSDLNNKAQDELCERTANISLAEGTSADMVQTSNEKLQ